MNINFVFTPQVAYCCEPTSITEGGSSAANKFKALVATGAAKNLTAYNNIW